MSHATEVIIVGGGVAGLSAAIYLGRSYRDTLLIESGHSMAVWELDVQNYLGFPDGIAGETLLERGRVQAARFGVRIIRDTVERLTYEATTFHVHGRRAEYAARRVLLATGLTHLAPEIPGVRECLGKSLFFCKDCDAYRVQGRRIVVIGQSNETADYALAMLAYSPAVMVATNGNGTQWDEPHQAWLKEYAVPIEVDRIRAFEHDHGKIRRLLFEGGGHVEADAVFTTRGDIYHTDLAGGVGAKLDREGQLVTDEFMRTSVPGLYAAGCVTPANCQMIIAAGQGAIAAQAINKDLFEESLGNHALPVWEQQLEG